MGSLEDRSKTSRIFSRGDLPALVLALLAPALMLATGILGFSVDAGPHRRFLGFSHLSSDLNAYASFVQQTAREGRLLTENRFTTEPQSGRFFLPYFVAVGLLERASGLPLPVIWYGVGFLVEAAFLLAAFWAFRPVFVLSWQPRFFVLCLAFGGGLGFLPAMGAGSLAGRTDLAYQRGLTTFSQFWNPYPFSAYVFLLLAVGILVRERRSGPGLFSVSLLAFLGHAYTGIVLAATLLTALLLARLVSGRAGWLRSFGRLYPGLLGIGFVGLFILWQRGDPVFVNTSSFFFRHAPVKAVDLCLGVAPLLPLAFVGLRKSPPPVVISWLLAALVLTLNPWILAARFQFATHLPLCLLATLGLPSFLGRYRLLAIILVTTLFLSFPFVLTKALEARFSPVHFVSDGEVAAARRLDQLAPGNLLSSYWPSSRFAWLSRGKYVYLGQTFLTPNWRERSAEVDRFFRTRGSGYKRWLLQKGRIDYVYWPRSYSSPQMIPGFIAILSNSSGILYRKEQVESPR